jgi:predicted ArsR family transcriptional regulator
MHSTKTEILALLKRSDGAAVDEIASSLGLASMTVRQHLTALERDALVSASEVRRATGRPHYRYALTEDGHRQVAQGYDRMVALIVEAAGTDGASAGATADERRAHLFRTAALSLAERHRGEVASLAGERRATRIVEILQAHGGFADWQARDEGFEVRDFSCIYRTHVDGCGPCQWHEPFLSALLGEPVAPAPETDDCAACCRYLISIEPRTS